MQGVACIPGISRSGTTIVTGMMCGLSREDSVKFSFLLSIPIILGGIFHELFFCDEIVISSIFGWPMLIGFIFAFITGVAAIRLVNKLATNNKFHIFSIYLFVIGILCILNSYFCVI